MTKLTDKPSKRKRADLLLVDRGLAESREQAQTLIAEGLVFSRAGRVLKASSILPRTDPLEVRGNLPYVSRGGLKLAHALDNFNLVVQGFTVLDVGASTGGFTDCVLQRGAEHVYALDQWNVDGVDVIALMPCTRPAVLSADPGPSVL